MALVRHINKNGGLNDTPKRKNWQKITLWRYKDVMMCMLDFLVEG